jgi:hypothetical protein
LELTPRREPAGTRGSQPAVAPRSAPRYLAVHAGRHAHNKQRGGSDDDGVTPGDDEHPAKVAVEGRFEQAQQMPPLVPQYYCNQAPAPQLTQQAIQVGGGNQLLTVRILTGRWRGGAKTASRDSAVTCRSGRHRCCAGKCRGGSSHEKDDLRCPAATTTPAHAAMIATNWSSKPGRIRSPRR